MTYLDIFRLFENVNVRVVDDKPVLYKPLLILYALEQCHLRNERLMRFESIERRLSDIFDDCFPNEPYKNFHHAFGRLENDGVWEVVDKQNLRHTSSGDLYKSELIKNNVVGGFTKEIFDGLTSDYFLITEVGDLILQKYIDASIHPEILKKLKYK